MPDPEEEIYSIMFSSLKHPARRKILRMLADRSMTFSQMLDALGVSSSHLTYHLENLGELVSKAENGEYRLSTFGAASVDTMKIVEEAPAVRSKMGLPLSLKWRSLLAILVIAVVLFASMSYVQYASLNQLSSDHELLKSRYEQLLSWSATTDTAITFIQEVVQIDTEEYHATLLSDTVEHRTDLGGIVEEILRYSLTNIESQIDVIFRFRNQKLSRYQLSLFEGSPIFAQPQPYILLDTVKDLMERLGSFGDDLYLEEMGNMLASVEEIENNEIVEGSIKLKISVSGSRTQFLWMHTENGVDFSPKSLSLVYENNVLKELTDGYFLFTVGTTQLNVASEDYAIEIARNAMEDFTWTAEGIVVSDFKVLEQPVSAIFHPTLREEGVALIPYWEVTLYLDKVYPGGINRIAVGIWADTAQIRRIRTASG
ncbi:MAG: winged helix-turn-helix domain-containing protein [Candidatus Bathyarchaeota archaeon]|nr:winged helix-turn-helix domain-containing protein [Candidatus Bathyarchaeota archaeon]